MGGWLQYEESTVNMGEKWKIGPELQTSVWINYKVTENLLLQLDFGMINNGDTYYGDELAIKGGMLLGGGLFAQFNIFSNNNWARTGVAFSMGTLPGTYSTGTYPGTHATDPSPANWFRIISIPILFRAELPF